MAYGKGRNRDTDKRVADLGRSAVSPDLARLRLLVREACQSLAMSVWPASVLDDLPAPKPLDAAMLAVQATYKGTLNSVWAEKARLAAKEAVKESHRRAMGRLFGRFKHIGTVGEQPMEDGTRRLLNLPEAWSRRLSDRDVAALQALADTLDFVGARQILRKLSDGHAVSLPPLHADALRALLADAEARHVPPRWDDPEAVVQLHLDFRCLPGGRAALEALLAAMNQAIPEVLASGKTARATFLVSGVVARGAPIKLDALLTKNVLERLLEPAAGEPRVTSLALEIGPEQVVVRGVLSQQPKVTPLSEVTHLVGRDFGFTNTVAYSVVRVDRPIDGAMLAEARDWSKEQVKAYLASHAHDGDAVEQVLHSGRRFLDRVAEQARRVDALRSQIDLLTNRVRRIKREANRLVGQPSDAWIDLRAERATDDRRLLNLLAKLPRLLAQLGRLKALRRGVYRSVEGLKASWFGWLTSREAELAKRHNAAVVREDLTVVAAEKDGPSYKGRTFNKMINGGSKGQFLHRARMKLAWRGIPEVVVPSAWTSSTDVRHGVVDRAQRRGGVFRAKADGREMQADLHAALTLALWPLLRPIVPSAEAHAPTL